MESKGQQIKLQIFDTAGQEKFHSLAPFYFKNANVIVLLYDITDEQSFLDLNKWILMIKENTYEDLIFFIVGNKIDLQDEQQVFYDDCTNLAKKYDAIVKMVSVKQFRGVQELFQSILDKILKQNQQSDISVISHSFRLQNVNSNQIEQQKIITKKKKCC